MNLRKITYAYPGWGDHTIYLLATGRSHEGFPQGFEANIDTEAPGEFIVDSELTVIVHPITSDELVGVVVRVFTRG